MNIDDAAAFARKPLSQCLSIIWHDADKNFSGNRTRRSVDNIIDRDCLGLLNGARSRSRVLRYFGVNLFEKPRHELRFISIIIALNHPATGTADSSSADVENMNSCIQFIAHEGKNIRIGSVAQNHSVLFEHRSQRLQVVAFFSRGFKIELSACFAHLGLDLAQDGSCPAFHELAHCLGKSSMFFLGDTPDTRG